MTRSRVPLILKQWFAGQSVLAELYGLRRIECRWRAIEVTANLGSPAHPWVVSGRIKEFRTKKGADACAERWRFKGCTVMVQPCVMLWLTNDELP